MTNRTPFTFARLALLNKVASLACLTAFSIGHALAAANAIESVEVSSLPGNQTLIKVHMVGDAIKPTGFVVATPPRIALDFPDVTSNVAAGNISGAQGNLKSVNVVETNNRSRMVIALQQTAPYEVTTQGKDVLIKIGVASDVAGSSTTATTFAEAKPNASKGAIRDIDFRKGRDGEGRIVIDLGISSPGIDIRQQGKLLLVDMTKISLPSNLQRRLDVTDFGTPVDFITAKSNGDRTNLVIEPKGTWDYSAYQTDGQLVIEVKKHVESNKPQNKVYTGEKLTLNFQNTQVRDVLSALADFTQLNIITSDTVTGNLTLRLKDVPWDQAFDIVMQAKGLDSRRKGNVILVAPRDELATKEKLALEAQQNIADLEPTRTESFQVNYQKAKVLFDFLKDDKNRLLTKRGSVIVDERTNQLFVSDIPSKLDEIRQLLSKIDIATKQIMIEARIVIAEESFSNELGGRLQFSSSTTGSSSLITGGGSAFKVPGVGGFLGLALGTSDILSLELKALEVDSRGKVLSNPKVMTMDQQPAEIKSGVQLPYKTCSTVPGSPPSCTVTFKDAFLILKVTPQITPDNRVSLTIAVNKDTKGETTDAGPAINKREITTQVLLSNGETTVIGGIFELDSTTDAEKTPLLGDVPVLGWLFKRQSKVSTKRELMVFITPRIIDDRVVLR